VFCPTSLRLTSNANVSYVTASSLGIARDALRSEVRERWLRFKSERAALWDDPAPVSQNK